MVYMLEISTYLPNYLPINLLTYLPTADVRLEDADKAKWSDWTRMNVQRHWDDTDGPLLSSDVIVIDDPQGEVTLGIHTYIHVMKGLS